MLSRLSMPACHRWIAAFVALACAAAQPGVPQATALLAALFHAKHEAQLMAGPQHVEAVLHHHHEEGSHEHAACPHGTAMQAADHDDHVLHFASLDPMERGTKALIRGPVVKWSTLEPGQPLAISLPISPKVASCKLPEPRPPPWMTAVNDCLRTTVIMV